MQFVEIELVKDQDPETIPLCGVILRKSDGSVIYGRAEDYVSRANAKPGQIVREYEWRGSFAVPRYLEAI